jgi:hypothetical protein
VLLQPAAEDTVVADNTRGTGEVTGKVHATHTIRVALRAPESFTISTTAAPVHGVGQKHCTALQRGDCYEYLWREVTFASSHCTSFRTGFPNVKK